METLLWRLHNVMDGQFRLWMSKKRKHVVTMAPNLFPQSKRLQKLDIRNAGMNKCISRKEILVVK